MRYIVTGGAGFIGSHLADTLAQHHDVIIIDNLATGRRENIEHLLGHPRVSFVEGSVTDLDLLMEVFPGAGGIFHQAAIPSVPRSVKDRGVHAANVPYHTDSPLKHLPESGERSQCSSKTPRNAMRK